MKTFFLFFLMGHVLGDFILQSEKRAAEKAKSFMGVVKHSFEYMIVMLLMTVPVYHIDMLAAAFYVGIVHFLVDSVKYFIVKKFKIKNEWNIFCADQITHMLLIAVLAMSYEKWNFVINLTLLNRLFAFMNWDLETVIRWAVALLIVNKPVNVMIQKFLKGYKPLENGNQEKDILGAEKNAGRMVGILERTIMLIFIYNSQFAALGLVLTAKSITRYNKIADDKAFAEYYLLGTLLSVLAVLGVGYLILLR